MEDRFGHDFSQVRVHTGAGPARAAAALAANAFTVGEDIVFGAGRYAPDTPAGSNLLAHELAHVVQQSGSSGPPASLGVTHPASPVEAEAEQAAADVAAGAQATVTVSSPPVIARSLWDDITGGAAGVWDSVTGTGQAIGQGAAAVHGGMQTASHILDLGEKEAWKGIDSVENLAKPKGKSNTGIGALDAVNDASAWMGEQSAGVLGGMAKGAVGLVGGLGKMAVDPVGTVLGAEAFLEHNSPVPFLGTTLKAGHGLLDLALGTENPQYGSSMGELANHLFNPLQQSEDDAKFNTALATNILAPGEKGWQNWIDKPGDALGHAAFNVGSLFIGAGEASAAGKLGRAGEVASAANDAAKVREAAAARDAAAAREAAAARDAAAAREASAGRPQPKPFDPSKPPDWEKDLSDLRPKPTDTAPARSVPVSTGGRGIGGAMGDAWDWFADLFKSKPKPKPQPQGPKPPENFYGPNAQGGVVKRGVRGWRL